MSFIPFHTIDWKDIPVTEHHGLGGKALWQTRQYGSLRVRIVEYTPGYQADHWCKTGHLVYCISGAMTCELADGSRYTLSEGMSYHVSDNASMHRSTTDTGVKLLIIDGAFLKPHTTKIFNPWKM
jgi:quercetin dioxygenase-like cupin family protein